MKFILKKHQFGKFCRYEIKSISNEKAKEHENEGHKVFDSRKQAESYRRSLN